MGYSGKDKHSRAGREFLKYGDKGYEELMRSRQSTARLKKKVSAINTKSETKQQKEQRTRMSKSTISSKPLSSKEWHAKHKGGNVTQASLRAYRGYLRGFGRK